MPGVPKEGLDRDEYLGSFEADFLWTRSHWI